MFVYLYVFNFFFVFLYTDFNINQVMENWTDKIKSW